MKLATAAQVRELDRRSIEEIGVPGVALMENAGRNTAYILHERLDAAQQQRGAAVAIFCGGGNNGGDGYVIARHLAELGHRPEIIMLSSPEKLSGDAATNHQILTRMGTPIQHLASASLPEDADFQAALRAIADRGFEVWVDALLGTGLSSDVRGRYAEAIAFLNEQRGLRVAVDLPSGLNADTGQPLGVAFEADLTVTYGLSKPGLHLDPGRQSAGEVVPLAIGFPVHVVREAELEGELLEDACVPRWLKPRKRDGHKGTYGHVLVLGGDAGKTGAVILSGVGAIRGGAGLVTVGTSASGAASASHVAWELMSEPLLDGPPSSVALEPYDVIAAGPGLGQGERQAAWLETVLESGRPLVLDADALNLLAARPELMERRVGSAVLTPHPGEMARLTGLETAEVVARSLEVTRALACDRGVIVALKTASTVVAHPDGRYAINSSGTPGMATAGMGDVLTGLIASLIAQGLTPWEASCGGVFLHGRAGERAASRLGLRGLTSRGLLDALPETLAAYGG